WDGGGHDTYDFSNYTTNLSVNLQPGAWSTASAAQLANLGGGHIAAGNIANALLYHDNPASLIEDVIGGTGNDNIVGNAADNHFTGGKGNDTIDGGAGIDTAIFSGARDHFIWAHNTDGSWTVTDMSPGGDGVDTLWNIEFMQFTDMTIALDGSTPLPPSPPPVVTNTAPTMTSTAPLVSLTEWADKSANEVANTAHTATGTLTYADADTGQVHGATFRAQSTNYLGTFSLNTGSIDSNHSVGWSFAVADSALDYLKAGQTLTQRYDVTIDDGHGGSTTQTVTITLIGADDAVTKAAKGGGSGKGGNAFGLGANPSDAQLLKEMQHDQAAAPYPQLDAHAGVDLPAGMLIGASHAYDSLFGHL
ncbi:MAG TPA: VCBS domain-containing protein, partial [Bradyrhizobium sp.]|nr:VCBS domain-containing protein [Bradyrhizobium sp.]